MESSSKLYSTNTTEPMGELNTSLSSLSNTISSTSYNHLVGISSTNTNKSTGSSSGRVVRNMEMENLSFEVSKYPRDLFQHFLGGGNRRLDDGSKRTVGSMTDDEIDDDDKGVNLGLGLSLGGKFGVDKSHKGLVRSSSIAGTMPLLREDEGVAAAAVKPPQQGVSTLVRTSSLPVETEEEWRKRKEMQTLRRMEAKRRRSEKQRVLKEAGGGGGGGGGGGEEKGLESVKFRGRLEREQQCLGITSKFIGSSMGSLFGSATPPPPPPTNVEVKGRRSTFGSLQGFLIAQGQVQPGQVEQGQGQGQRQGQQVYSQGSGESQGGGGGTSSGASELESKTHQGSSSCGEARSPSSIHSRQERGSQEAAGSPRNMGDGFQRGEAESSSKTPEAAENKRRESSSSGIEDMPCVFTIGDGPNGRKVEGILYKYGKGEEVRIMCVCHGNFFTPADFVKHAGGRDVEHPLRHIVVSPPSSAFQ